MGCDIMSDRLRTYLPLIYIAEIEVRRVLGEIETPGQERQNGKFFFERQRHWSKYVRCLCKKFRRDSFKWRSGSLSISFLTLLYKNSQNKRLSGVALPNATLVSCCRLALLGCQQLGNCCLALLRSQRSVVQGVKHSKSFVLATNIQGINRFKYSGSPTPTYISPFF